MEAVDTGNKQSGTQSLINRERRYSPTKDIFTRGYPSATTMATAAIMNPISIFPPHTHPTHPPPPYSHASSASIMARPLSALVSPTTPHSAEPRRPSDDAKDFPPPQRQSLPSIHEALLDATPSAYSTYSTISTNQYTPAPYAPASLTPTSRSFPSDSIHNSQLSNLQPPRRNSPPYPVHPPPSSFPRTEPPSGFDGRRGPPPMRNPPPPQAQSSSYPRPGPGGPPAEPEARPYERLNSQSSYSSGSQDQYRGYPTAPAASMQPPPSQQPPNGQYPRHYRHVDEYIHKAGEPQGDRHAASLKRSLNLWDVEQCLTDIVGSARTMENISGECLTVAQRWSHIQGKGYPTLAECEAMISEHEKMRGMLYQIREAAVEQQHIVADQQQQYRGQNGNGSADPNPNEGHAWSGEFRDPNYGEREKGNNPKRTRAAPPGRCHSCNRAETPEWRRGPDGARTLCNACGLHYAKLTRKTGNKPGSNQGSSLRPKSMDES